MTAYATERMGSAGVIHLVGEVTGASEAALVAAYESATGPGIRAVVLDCADLEYLNSAGIGLLVMLLVRARQAGLQLLAAGVDPHHRRVLQLTRLDQVIALHPDLESAVAAAEAE